MTHKIRIEERTPTQPDPFQVVRIEPTGRVAY